MISLKKIAFAAALTVAAGAQAQDLKIGVILPLTGPFAAHGQQLENSIRLYMRQHGDTVAGRKIRLIIKDDTGIAPAVSKRQAQELLVRDKVDLLAGFGMTPSAFSVAPLAQESRTPMVVMNAATSSITTKSDYIVRTSFTLPQVTTPIAAWSLGNGIKTVYTIVADYGPGHDAEAEFTKTFTAGGGKIVGQVRTPVSTPDFAPFLQKAKDAKPDAIFVMLPAGEQGVAFVKGYKERGLDAAGIRLVTTGDLTDEGVIDAMGDAALGMITSFHYSQAHESAENKTYVADYLQAYPGQRPNFWTVGGYDGMHLIYDALRKTGGNADGDAFMAAVKGMHWMSPRGPVSIDPQTRDLVQDVYIRKVERVGSVLQNVEFDKQEQVKDPGK
ncbi:ABC transporter substrate-binding protein [Castellaniella sp.]|uniref:ABC transporter substrate-binding protein n=1 Tax=Castellaniella sp. TaxID=1955812 RepID=UPI002AFE4F15|nr:ABC transporter substrate-binding protein [Castellaniella sp.]